MTNETTQKSLHHTLSDGDRELVRSSPPTVNSIQYGGDHYKKNGIQPWDYIVENNIGYLEGSAIKYLTRWKDKGGIQDLKKAVHFIEKLIEVEEKKLESK